MQDHDISSKITIFNILVGAVVSLVSAFLVYKAAVFKKKNEGVKEKNSIRDTYANELVLHSEIARKIQDNQNRLRASNELNIELDLLYSQTRAERFLILIAVNGEMHYTAVSAIYQWPKKVEGRINGVKRYNSLEIDDNYREMLSKAIRLGVVNIYTADIQGTLLGSIYLDEGVTQSRVYYIEKISLGEKGRDILVYVSIATFHEEGFTPDGINKMNLLVRGNMKRYIAEIVGYGK